MDSLGDVESLFEGAARLVLLTETDEDVSEIVQRIGDANLCSSARRGSRLLERSRLARLRSLRVYASLPRLFSALANRASSFALRLRSKHSASLDCAPSVPMERWPSTLSVHESPEALSARRYRRALERKYCRARA